MVSKVIILVYPVVIVANSEHFHLQSKIMLIQLAIGSRRLSEWIVAMRWMHMNAL